MGGRHRFGSYWRLRLRWRDRQGDFPWLLLLSLFLHSNNNELGEYNFATTSTHQLSAVVNLGQSCDTFPATTASYFSPEEAEEEELNWLTMRWNCAIRVCVCEWWRRRRGCWWWSLSGFVCCCCWCLTISCGGSRDDRRKSKKVARCTCINRSKRFVTCKIITFYVSHETL